MTTAAPATAEIRPRLRLVGLDGARGVCCLAILVSHVADHLSPESAREWQLNLLATSLVFFYVLSGFLLFLPYARGIAPDSGEDRFPQPGRFAVNRALRVLPAYVVVFLLCNFVLRAVFVDNPATQPEGSTTGTGMITDPLQLLANLTLVQSYVPSYFQEGLNVTWSLSVEVAFYVSLPLLGLLVRRLHRNGALGAGAALLAAPAVLLLLGILGKLVGAVVQSESGLTDAESVNFGPNGVAVLLRSFVCTADHFAIGMFLAVLFVAVERGRVPDSQVRTIRLVGVAAFLPLLAAAVLLLAWGTQFAFSVLALGSAVLIAQTVLPAADVRGPLLARCLDLAPIRYLGLISLSVYLWHYPVLMFLAKHGWLGGDTHTAIFANTAAVMVVTVVLSTVTYYAVELPAMNADRRSRRPRR